MKCGPKPKDRPPSATNKEKPVASKMRAEQRKYQSKIEMISVLSFGKAPNFAQSPAFSFTG